MSDGTGESLFDSRTGQLATACSKLIIAVGTAPGGQSKSSKYKKRLRRFVGVTIRNATNDDCSLGIFGRPDRPGMDKTVDMKDCQPPMRL
jgi:hypothetical protein